MMGTPGRDVKGIVPATATRRQVVLHNDVIAYQQPICQETRCWEEALFAIRAVMVEEQVDVVVGDLQRCRLAPPLRQRSNEEALADTNLPMPPGCSPLWVRCSARRMGGCVRISQVISAHTSKKNSFRANATKEEEEHEEQNDHSHSS